MGSILAQTSRTSYDKPIGHRKREHAIRGKSKLANPKLADTKLAGIDPTSSFVSSVEFIPNSGSVQGSAAEDRKREIRYGPALKPELVGADGADGVIGSDGADGAAGIPGAPGTDGAVGADGADAALYWVGARVPIGSYFAGDFISSSSIINPAVSYLHAQQIHFGRSLTYDSMSVYTTSVPGGVNQYIRIGLYEDEDGLPGALIEASGDIDCSASGMHTFTFATPLTLQGQYWVGYSVHVAFVKTLLGIVLYTQPAFWLTHLSSGITDVQHVLRVFSHAALPDPWGSMNEHETGHSGGLGSKLAILFKRVAGGFGDGNPFPEPIPGPPGVSGRPGEDGEPGDPGTPGPPGAAGAAGTIGPQGPAGRVGEDGDQGEWGPPGLRGIDGVTGLTGSTGPPGRPGEEGEQGEQGFPGLQGIRGEEGDPGPQGPVGLFGADGEEGPQGFPGPQGIQGVTGANGQQGPVGLFGAEGEDGPQGFPGQQGIPGPSVLSKASGTTTPCGENITWLTLSVTSATITGVTPAVVMTITTVGAGTYYFKCQLIYQTTATTTGIDVSVNHTGVLTDFIAEHRFSSTGQLAGTAAATEAAASAVGNLYESQGQRTKDTAIGAGTVSVDLADTNMMSTIEGFFIVSNVGSGDLQIKLAAEAALLVCTARAGSFLELKKLS